MNQFDNNYLEKDSSDLQTSSKQAHTNEACSNTASINEALSNTDYRHRIALDSDSNSLYSNLTGAVALVRKSKLRNGDPSGDSKAIAPLEFVNLSPKTTIEKNLRADKFISDNLQDEYAIDITLHIESNAHNTIASQITTHKRPAGEMRQLTEWTIGLTTAFSWLRRSDIRARLSWRAERLARILFTLKNNTASILSNSLNRISANNANSLSRGLRQHLFKQHCLLSCDPTLRTANASLI